MIRSSVKFHFSEHENNFLGWSARLAELKLLYALLDVEFSKVWNVYSKNDSLWFSENGEVVKNVYTWDIYKRVNTGEFTFEKGEVIAKVVVTVEPV